MLTTSMHFLSLLTTSLVTAGQDATTRVWRVDNGYSMALLAHGGDWIVYTPDGYFDSSHYGGDLVDLFVQARNFKICGRQTKDLRF